MSETIEGFEGLSVAEAYKSTADYIIENKVVLFDFPTDVYEERKSHFESVPNVELAAEIRQKFETIKKLSSFTTNADVETLYDLSDISILLEVVEERMDFTGLKFKDRYDSIDEDDRSELSVKKVEDKPEYADLQSDWKSAFRSEFTNAFKERSRMKNNTDLKDTTARRMIIEKYSEMDEEQLYDRVYELWVSDYDDVSSFEIWIAIMHLTTDRN